MQTCRCISSFFLSFVTAEIEVVQHRSVIYHLKVFYKLVHTNIHQNATIIVLLSSSAVKCKCIMDKVDDEFNCLEGECWVVWTMMEKP